ncbi:MAG TPA: DUF2007 domain-containing protein [Chloroflexia bacterium]|nr:DUF2007 domain-containing protein [Chloroflexia bacterium]
MTNLNERYCSSCGRIYSQEDWQEENCPFCDVPLEAAGEHSAGMMDDTLTTEIPWPKGEREVEVCRASGYLDAQLVKAQLEGAGIPVLLHAGAKLGFTVGDLGAVPVLVPKSRLQDAREVLADRLD